jgi:hypothetical protein
MEKECKPKIFIPTLKEANSKAIADKEMNAPLYTHPMKSIQNNAVV